MATDATNTPTTNYSIPKFLTNTDRPTGQGFNAAVDFLDSLLFNSATLLGAKARVVLRKNSGADVGARRRINLIEGSGITLTLADDAANEEVDVTIAAASGASIVTSLPGSPADGDEVILVDSTTAPTYAWRFKYSSGISDANKWLFIGGAKANAEHGGSTSSGSGNGVWEDEGDLFTFPRAGVYRIELQGVISGHGSATSSALSVGINTQSITLTGGNAHGGLSQQVTDDLTVSASDVLDLYHRDDDATRRMSFSAVRVVIEPLRVA